MTALLGACASAFGGVGRVLRRQKSQLSSTAAPLEAYAELKQQLKEVARLQEIEGILSYDEQVFRSVLPPRQLSRDLRIR